MTIINKLPPLPPARVWPTYFPSKYLPISPDKNMIRKSVGRKLLTNQGLCDEFVKNLKIRKGEIIIEGYSGVGNLTRSLLSGGNYSTISKNWTIEMLEDDQVGSEVAEDGKKKIKSKGKKKTYPIWLEELQTTSTSTSSFADTTSSPESFLPTPTTSTTQQDTSSSSELPLPKLVVASEGSLELLTRSFNYPSKTDTKLSSTGREISQDPYTRPIPVLPSPLHPNLLLSHSTVYVWPTLPKILENPLVSNQLPIHDPTLPPGSIDSTKRSWEDGEPPITVVCQMPDSSIGEQLAAQWIGSAVGDKGQKRTWIWEWGRIRLALLCGRSLYDRMLATPGSIIHCKLSILTQALFDIVPLPPYHHVNNVDKQSKITTDRPIKPSSSIPPSSLPPNGVPSSSSSSQLPGYDYPISGQHTLTYPLDFFPPSTTSQRLIHKPLDRTELLGVLLIPKIESPILSSQKDTWDFVMRRLFVRDTLTLKQGLPNLSFGADTLITNIEDKTKRFRGIPVDGERVIRDLNVNEWLRIVDVFDNWAFKPDNLILDSGNPDELSRELGQD